MGLRGCILLPCTNRQLSGRVLTQTVFVTAFFVLPILYHVRGKKSNVFASENKNFFSVQFSLLYLTENWEICLLTNGPVCGLMTNVYMTKTKTENSLLFQMLQRAGGWCEPVRKISAICFPSRFCKRVKRPSNGTRLPPLQG